ncbi:5'-phosphoribosylglycinamide transformylase [Corynebacterium kutscheri]|uniref:5'-phosphoribosylglycinamide transformylase n=1 Tax=Corynebacterium kutscheri TaxID=35755 RepID=A0A0F6TDW5_9CORY|nr:formate-dependent phosphoribosylglycinamide formyltransferase [Corynebacterium kutscheri]AKE42016.1 formate-dependent phosphoribosylglycinamide formyltransferase [Corynebacterium kutscheri]VEH06158.1 5'-phosphoribosylglycinamide transformylase [Corynebacterium kutscheri]VEH10357.1 5'-phosphoribosylglycinamide transformylase [Corynebacterium kutscheri]VEH82073.1 5'-phosphoribosylglycinamide transformylase [Corynebacterium kutscheri]
MQLEVLRTASSNRPTRVLILGAGELAKEVAIAFHNLGVEVHIADESAAGLAAHVAKHSYAIDLLAPQEVVAVVKQVQPDVVVPMTERISSAALTEIGTYISVVPHSATAAAALNREVVRAMASDLGLPMSKWRVVGSREEYLSAVEEMGYPCVTKPVNSTTGRGNAIISSAADRELGWAYAGDDRVIVERFVDFDVEITLLVARSINPETGELATWFCEPIGHRNVAGQLVEAWQPLDISSTALDNARSVAARISNAIGGQGLFGVEIFVSGDDVYFSGISSRPHHTGLVTLATQRFNQFELHARAILGLPLDVTVTSPGACAVVTSQIDTDNAGIAGLGFALAVPESDVRIFAKDSAFIGRRMAIALTTAETVSQARHRASEAASYLKVVEA